MSPLRVSAISYLNTAPLMWDFEHGPRAVELRREFEVDYTIPSRCAQMLAEGSADIGIIPIAAYKTIDLAEEWRNATGKPFVFAFWAVRKNAATEEELGRITDVFRESRDEGLKHIAEIADEWSPKLSIPADNVRSYLRDNIHYFLDPESISGMKLFFELAASYGILPSAPELRLVPEL